MFSVTEEFFYHSKFILSTVMTCLKSILSVNVTNNGNMAIALGTVTWNNHVVQPRDTGSWHCQVIFFLPAES
jgi:hypothetical protein